MAEAGIDVLMKVVGAGGAFSAEGTTTFTGPAVQDPLRNGFTPGQFCELQAFSFSVGAESSMDKKDKDGDGDKEKNGKGRDDRQRGEARSPGQWIGREAGSSARLSSSSGDTGFGGTRRSAARDDVDIRPVEFTRIMDSMSTQLFSALVGCETLESLTVVKRRASGRKNSGACYLRLDFTKVLVIDLEWKDNQHVMIETGTFIYRKVKVLYRPQKPDGSLDVAVQAEWEMPAGK